MVARERMGCQADLAGLLIAALARFDRQRTSGMAWMEVSLRTDLVPGSAMVKEVVLRKPSRYLAAAIHILPVLEVPGYLRV